MIAPRPAVPPVLRLAVPLPPWTRVWVRVCCGGGGLRSDTSVPPTSPLAGLASAPPPPCRIKGVPEPERHNQLRLRTPTRTPQAGGAPRRREAPDPPRRQGRPRGPGPHPRVRGAPVPPPGAPRVTRLFTCLGGRSCSLRRGCQRLARGGRRAGPGGRAGGGGGGGGPIGARVARTRAHRGAGARGGPPPGYRKGVVLPSRAGGSESPGKNELRFV